MIMVGKVKWFDPIKKYGFITNEAGEDVYVHLSGVTSGRTFVGFNKGDTVEFETKTSKRGAYATGVSLVADEASDKE